jgi:superfamily II DNA or RNA helicase
MPRYLFSWDAFDDALVLQIARERGETATTAAEARLQLTESILRPNQEFARAHKQLLIHWLAQEEKRTFEVVVQLQHLGLGPSTGHIETIPKAIEFLSKCRNSSGFRRVMLERFIRAGNVSKPESHGHIELMPRHVVILDPKKQADDRRIPHPFQKSAWSALNTTFAEAEATKQFRGVLEMPTGAGKTYTAVHWLLSRLVNSGRKVLWVAHRQELLNQAFRTFTSLLRHADRREKVRIRVVSGAHACTTQVDPSDDIVIASIASLARRPDITEALLTSSDRFVVIDEAHHAASTSYRNLLALVTKRVPSGYLGLTATFTRTLESERPELARLFGEKPSFSISQRELIDQNILSRPRLERVSTHVNAEEGMDDSDYRHVSRFQELSEKQQNRLAKMAPRNKAVVDRYTNNIQKYAKTLIFAINVEHAALLTALLREALPASERDRVQYVASHHPDESQLTTSEVFARFREPFGALGGVDVLVNVQMATEGVDFPNVQTVFLVRPTTSEILLRQMVGRALRGIAAGGTADAYIVNFTDDWTHLRGFDTPLEALVASPATALQAVEVPAGPTLGASVPPLGSDSLPLGVPWASLVEIARELVRRDATTVSAFEAVPAGWLLLRGGPTGRATVPVLSNHRASWDALRTKLENMQGADLAAQTSDELYEYYFSDCEEPLPPQADIEMVLKHYKALGERMEFVPFEKRAEVSPEGVAATIAELDLGEKARVELIRTRYLGLAAAIYPSIEAYRAAVDRALQSDGAAEHQNPMIPIFEPQPKEMLPFTEGHHDLHRLLAEVMSEGAALLSLPVLPGEPSVGWTRHIVKGKFAQAKWEPDNKHGEGEIIVNRLLQSREVSQATLKFLLWHEYLHLFLKDGHPPIFRERERLWPGHVEADREIDTLTQRFGARYW